MIALFTDFGSDGPYLGQLFSVLDQQAPDTPVINLISNAPVANPRLSAYLLAALSPYQPQGTVFVCVVDPGVGGARLPIVLQADGRWFVGPDNGLLNSVACQARHTRWWTIEWRPDALSSSFHGRDLFAPVAARIAVGTADSAIKPYPGPALSDWPSDLAAIVYIDHYGNAMTGCRYSTLATQERLFVNEYAISRGETFCSVPQGTALWYENSCGLVEIAVNGGRADAVLGLALGDTFGWSVN